jgi:signal transduction histidine kinase
MEPEEEEVDWISFSVDAGLVNRLGRELVGKPETALSELVKNSYDADANKVSVKFYDSDKIGGNIIIEDDGVGMDIEALKRGFMRISSTDKVHNPQSIKFNRNKAGRKGIGRFATQRLGQKLTILTQTINSARAIKVTIDWNEYKIDTDLGEIQNKVEYVDKVKPEGTLLIIENAWESWSEATITRVYRHVSELLQPNYISTNSETLGVATKTDPSFKVSFVKVENESERIIADPDTMIFSKALATIEGYIDTRHDGYCVVASNSLDVTTDIIPIPHGKKYTDDDKLIENRYLNLSNVHFKVYYFIYNREQYYTSITKQELSNIQKVANESGGVKLYRNGFRVLPYGDPNDDWLLMDKRAFYDTGTNIPFANRNLFGFVEIIDRQGKFFEETASREGLIENEAYLELIDFLRKSLEAAKKTLRYGVEKIKKEVTNAQTGLIVDDGVAVKTTIEKLVDLEKSVNDLLNASTDNVTDSGELRTSAKKIFEEIKAEFKNLLDELGMLRVLAALGITIGEFTHEVIQFSPSIMGDLSVIGDQNLDMTGMRSLENLRRTIQLFTAYTSYFNATVSANVSRELRPQKLDKVVASFKNIIDSDIQKLNYAFDVETYGYDLYTLPMHASEWSSILFNLYTNSKKAIRREGVTGKIKIVIGKGEVGNTVYLEFVDNGDGIPDSNKSKIFEPFFTTSNPLGYEASEEEKLTGTGLGLKIVKDIVQTYGGSVEVIDSESGYKTTFRIELPGPSNAQKTQYGI